VNAAKGASALQLFCRAGEPTSMRFHDPTRPKVAEQPAPLT
jgi:hypothetical protein